MDFHFSPEQEVLRREVRAFLDENLTDELREEIEQGDHTPGPLGKALLHKLGEEGWLGLGWPEEYGGQGRSLLDQFVFYEEFDRERVHYGGLTLTSLAMTLIRLASDEQKQEFLPRILRGEVEFCLGYTEPGAGSDLASLTTRAERDGDEYVVNGQKVFTTGAHYSSHIWLLARTDPAAHKHKGCSLFLFPLDTPGVTVRPIYTMEGLRTNEVFLDAVRIPARCMIGAENQGFYAVAVALDYERVFLGKYVWLRRNLDDLIALCKTTPQDGGSLFDDPVVQDRLVRLHIGVERIRLLNYRVAWMIDRGEVPTAEASAQKIMASEIGQQIADEGMQILGPHALLEHGSPRALLKGRFAADWLLSPLMRFGGGTNEIQRDIIAQRELGLPRRSTPERRNR